MREMVDDMVDIVGGDWGIMRTHKGANTSPLSSSSSPLFPSSSSSKLVLGGVEEEECGFKGEMRDVMVIGGEVERRDVREMVDKWEKEYKITLPSIQPKLTSDQDLIPSKPNYLRSRISETKKKDENNSNQQHEKKKRNENKMKNNIKMKKDVKNNCGKDQFEGEPVEG